MSELKAPTHAARGWRKAPATVGGRYITQESNPCFLQGLKPILNRLVTWELKLAPPKE